MIKNKLPDFSQAKILVVGDLMLDRYWHGPASRISPEAPVPVIRIDETEERPGGAGNVALNIAGLGAKVTLLGLCGADEAAERLEHLLQCQGVRCLFERLENSTTITKLRVLSRHQQLIRLDFEDGFDSHKETHLQEHFKQALLDTDIVVFSDYQKGTLRHAKQFIQYAKQAGKQVLIDPKNRDYSHYYGANVITPNMSEFEEIVGHCNNDTMLEHKARKLCGEFAIDALLITRSEKGMTLVQQNQPILHLPTHALEVYDVTGAGDTVIASLAVSLAKKCRLLDAIQLANMAAGIVVGKVGTATVNRQELELALLQQKQLLQGIVTEEILLSLVAQSQQLGETIVMTNGCFDILHAGHVTYLQQAKQLGDRLIVAVNTDASVKRLKGHERPVNTQTRRMQVLAGLSCVDWVVSFSEDTPTRLICHILPDILVKGGDNDPDNIPGGECVRNAGGRVQVMDYIDNCSTTGLIRSIRAAEKNISDHDKK